MSQKKVWFLKSITNHRQYQQSGFTHEKIVELLRDQHDLDLVTVETFKVIYIDMQSESRYA